jgi:AcrR family transcriptional regulator
MSRKPRKGTVSEDGLTEESIVRIARQIVRESGAPGLTMRRLSDELGVALGATYHHVPDRKALMRLIAHDIYRDIELPVTVTGEWTDHIHTAMIDFTRLLGGHPGMAAEIARDTDAMIPTVLADFISERLGSTGFSEDRIDVVMASLFFFVGGYTLTAMNGSPILDRGGRSAMSYFGAGLRILLTGVAAELVRGSTGHGSSSGAIELKTK